MQFIARTTSHLRSTDQGLVLLATRSAPGGVPQFPPHRGALAGQTLEEVALGPQGRLHTWTVVHPGGGKPSTLLAMVDFAPGLRVFGPLFAPRQPAAFGATVKVVPHVLADGSTDYAFEVV